MRAQPNITGLHLDPAAQVASPDARALGHSGRREPVDQPFAVAVVGGGVNGLVDNQGKGDRTKTDRYHAEEEGREAADSNAEEPYASCSRTADEGNSQHPS